MSKKRSIPTSSSSYTPAQQHEFNVAVKETMEIITGRRAEPLTLLSEGASDSEIISKINAIIIRLQ